MAGRVSPEMQMETQTERVFEGRENGKQFFRQEIIQPLDRGLA